MKPIIYEIKRTLTSKFVIILIIAIVGLSSLLSYESAATFNSPSSAFAKPNLNYGYYIEGSNITMVGFAHNAYGEPASGVIAHFEYNGSFYSGRSNSMGFANKTFHINVSKQFNVGVNYTYSTFRSQKTTSQVEYSINLSQKFSGIDLIPGTVNPANSSSFGFQMLYVGNNGSPAPPLEIYVSNYSSGELSQSLATNHSFEFNSSGFIVKTFFPAVTYADRNNTYAVVVKNASGVSEVISTNPKSQYIGVIGPLTDYTPMTEGVLQDLVFSGTSQILGFLIPILAIFAGYLTYGRDRTSGVLESVLKRPVTRGELISSRFASNAIAIIIAVGLSMIFSDLIIHHYFGMYLSTFFSLYFIWTYVVEGIAFLAIVYLFSHVVKSQGALLGGSIGVFVVFDLFWSIIPVAILSALNVSSTTSSYILANIAFDYSSPAGYSSLVRAMFTDEFGLFGAETINPTAYGIISPILIVAGLLWMIVPFSLAYVLAKYRD